MLNKAGQRGFNLIEAIVVMAILAFLAATAGPSMVDWIKSVRVRNLAETTVAGLQKARGEALKRNKPVTFWLVTPTTTTLPDATCALSSASGAWVVSLDDPTSHCDTAPSPTAAPRIVESYGPGASGGSVTVTALASDETTAASSVSFDGYGQVVRTGSPIAVINIQHATAGAAARLLRVEVTTNGSIRMCDRSVAAPDPRACTFP